MGVGVITVWPIAQKSRRCDPVAFALCSVFVDSSIDSVEKAAASSGNFWLADFMAALWAMHGQRHRMRPVSVRFEPANNFISSRLVKSEAIGLNWEQPKNRAIHGRSGINRERFSMKVFLGHL